MAERTYYLDGAPSWPELTTSDLPTAVRFYEKIFGWTCKDLGPKLWHYTMCLVDDQPVAAITPPAVGLESTEPAWRIYLATSDAKASAVQVEANNGKLAILPMTLADYGSFALAVDPEGATFGLWQAGPHLGSRLYGEPGAMCWNELYARNVKLEDPFYQALFGYEQEQIGDGVDYDYVLWKIAGEPVCGRLRMPYEAERVQPHWKTYFTVVDIDATVASVVPEGGAVLIGAYETPYGRVAVLADPTGAAFAICEHTHESFIC
ncbi:VOC family protein [Sphaerisporangium sp. NPDC088356]|uniref:VOC family protein n=1 Tax=Sphaerisporangium sp. NPDC088356 TaxID=3154871 RepID=UPI003429BDE7